MAIVIDTSVPGHGSYHAYSPGNTDECTVCGQGPGGGQHVPHVLNSSDG